MAEQRSPAQWAEDADKTVVIDGGTARTAALILGALEELLARTELTREQVDCLTMGQRDLSPLRTVLPTCRQVIARQLDGDDDGSAGDRKPRTPSPEFPSASQAIPLDHE